MGKSRYNHTEDFLMTTLGLNATTSPTVAGNLTSIEFNELPSANLWGKLKNFLWEISYRFHVPLKNNEHKLIRMLAELNEENYELKTWHLKKIYSQSSAKQEVEFQITEALISDSDTAGVRQCAEAHITDGLRKTAILKNVLQYHESSSLEVAELNSAMISMLQDLIDLMNRILQKSHLTVTDLFKTVTAIVNNEQVTLISSLDTNAIAQLKLTPRSLALLNPIVKSHAHARTIDYNLASKFKYFLAMDHARNHECSRSYNCDLQKENYLLQLRFNRNFHKDPRVTENAGHLGNYLERTIQYHDTYCSLTNKVLPHFTNRSTLGLFKPVATMQDIYLNTTSVVEECDFQDVTPFLYFFEEALRAAPIQTIEFDSSLLSNNSVVHQHENSSILSRNEKDLTILIPMLILLMLLLRNYRLFRPTTVTATIEDPSDLEADLPLLSPSRSN